MAIAKFEELGKPKSKSGIEWRYNCPFCLANRGKEDKDGKLYWNSKKRVGECKKCGVVVLDFSTGRTTEDVFHQYVEKPNKKAEEPKPFTLQWAKPYDQFDWAVEYLTNKRGFSPEILVQHGVMAADYPDRMIVLPDTIYEDGNCNFFQVRYIDEGSPIRYTNPSEAIKPVYNLNRFKDKKMLIHCEGCFSAMSATTIDSRIGAIASFGKTLTPKQLLDIYNSGVKAIVVMIDGGEISSLISLLMDYTQTPLNISFVLLPYGEDPNSLTSAELKKAFSNSRFVATSISVDMLKNERHSSEWKDKDVQSWQALYKFCADKRWQCGVSSA